MKAKSDDPFWIAPQIPTQFALTFLCHRLIILPVQETVAVVQELRNFLEYPIPPPNLLFALDRIVDALCYRLEQCREHGARISEDAKTSPENCLLEHIISACLAVFSKSRTAKAVSGDAWRRLAECVTWAIVQRESKYYGLLINRMLRYGEQNMVYHQLLSMLERSSAEITQFDTGDSPIVVFTFLVLQFIWQRSKSLAHDLMYDPPQTRVVPILHAIHNILQTTPVSEYQRRQAEKIPLAMQPLRLMQELLKEMANTLGAGVLQEYRKLWVGSEKTDVYRWLEDYLRNGKMENDLDEPMSEADVETVQMIAVKLMGDAGKNLYVEGAESESGEEEENHHHYHSHRNNNCEENEEDDEDEENSSPNGRHTRIKTAQDISEEFTSIFAKLFIPEIRDEAILELFEFRLRHPETAGRIGERLARTGKEFQRVVREGFALHAAKHQAAKRFVANESGGGKIPEDDTALRVLVMDKAGRKKTGKRGVDSKQSDEEEQEEFI